MDDTNLDKTLSSMYIMPTFPIRSQCTLSLPPENNIKGALGTNGLIRTFEPRLHWDIKSIFLPRTWTAIIYKEQLKCKLTLTVVCTWKLQNSILMCPSKYVASAAWQQPENIPQKLRIVENWRKKSFIFTFTWDTLLETSLQKRTTK